MQIIDWPRYREKKTAKCSVPLGISSEPPKAQRSLWKRWKEEYKILKWCWMTKIKHILVTVGQLHIWTLWMDSSYNTLYKSCSNPSQTKFQHGETSRAQYLTTSYAAGGSSSYWERKGPYLKECSPWKAAHSIAEDHTYKNILSSKTGLGWLRKKGTQAGWTGKESGSGNNWGW